MDVGIYLSTHIYIYVDIGYALGPEPAFFGARMHTLFFHMVRVSTFDGAKKIAIPLKFF